MQFKRTRRTITGADGRRPKRPQILAMGVGSLVSLASAGGIVFTDATTATALAPAGSDAQTSLHRTDVPTPIGTTISKDLDLYSANKRQQAKSTFTITHAEGTIHFSLTIRNIESRGEDRLTPISIGPGDNTYIEIPTWDAKSFGTPMSIESKFTLLRNGTAIDYRTTKETENGTVYTIEGELTTEHLEGRYEVDVDGVVMPNTAKPNELITMSSRLGPVVIS